MKRDLTHVMVGCALWIVVILIIAIVVTILIKNHVHFVNPLGLRGL